jgi:hypothetical protein
MGQIPSTQQDISADLDLKADKVELTNGLALKADKTALTSGLALKADKTELNSYARTTALTSGLASKADKTELTSGLSLKADKTELASGLALKADKTDLTGYATVSALGLKADKNELDQYVKTINLPSPQNLSDYAKKADLAAYVPTSTIGQYATKTDLDTKFAGQASKIDLEAGLALKADEAILSQNYYDKRAVDSSLNAYTKTADMPSRTMWCADGNLCNMPVNRTVNIPSSTILHFGAGTANKEENSGKIGYGTFSNGTSLDIVGAGSAFPNRTVKVWDNLVVERDITVGGTIKKGQDTVVFQSSLAPYATKTEMTTGLAQKADQTAVYTKQDVDSRLTDQRNDITSRTLWCADGSVNCNVPSGKSVDIPSNTSLHFGSDNTTKDGNAGRIAYGAFGHPDKLSIVGGGTGSNRMVRVWDNLEVPGNITAGDFKKNNESVVVQSELQRWATSQNMTDMSKKTLWCEGPNCALPADANNVAISGNKSVEFGQGIAGKEANAGKIAYGGWEDDKLHIVGGGPSPGNRTVKVWDQLEVARTQGTGMTGPFKLRLYDKDGGNRCMDSGNAWTNGNGDHTCEANNKSQLFFYSPLTGQVQSVGNGQCLTQNGSAWNWSPCDTNNPNQQFWKKEHLLQWRNGQCLDLGNNQKKSACDGNNANQKMVWVHEPLGTSAGSVSTTMTTSPTTSGQVQNVPLF